VTHCQGRIRGFSVADQIEDFFPTAPQDTWKFLERGSLATVTVNYLAKPTGNRKLIELELTGLPSHVNPCFFDRLTLTEDGLELNRIRLKTRTVDINPSLLITLDLGESNEVAVLFPIGAVPVLYDQPPFGGKVTSKKLTPLDGQRKLFEVELVSMGQVGEKIFRVNKMHFQTGRGLTYYGGDMGGVFFVYERQD
jgi:hypothetical protein